MIGSAHSNFIIWQRVATKFAMRVNSGQTLFLHRFFNRAVIYTISDFAMPTLSALVVELYRMPELLGLLGKFKKCAVLCDTAWVRTAAEFEGAVFRSLDIKSFSLSDTEAAETWLNGRQESAEQEEEDANFPV